MKIEQRNMTRRNKTLCYIPIQITKIQTTLLFHKSGISAESLESSTTITLYTLGRSTIFRLTLAGIQYIYVHTIDNGEN